MNIVMFGAPGAGKGTHADILAAKYNLAHISTGELLRKEVAAKTPLGKELEFIMDCGELVKDEVVIELVNNYIHQETRGIIFDGFPRTVLQAEKLDDMLEDAGRKLDCVISIEVPAEELVRRMKERAQISHRNDDNEVTLRYRLKEYEEKTLPVLEYYRFLGNLVSVDAGGSIEETRQRIDDVVAARM